MEDTAPTPSEMLAAPPRKNRGSFREGDARINRQGRTCKGSRLPGLPADRRLMKLHVPMGDMRQYLRFPRNPWIVNLPPDYSFVAARLEGGDVVLTLPLRGVRSGPGRRADPPVLARLPRAEVAALGPKQSARHSERAGIPFAPQLLGTPASEDRR